MDNENRNLISLWSLNREHTIRMKMSGRDITIWKEKGKEEGCICSRTHLEGKVTSKAFLLLTTKRVTFTVFLVVSLSLLWYFPIFGDLLLPRKRTIEEETKNEWSINDRHFTWKKMKQRKESWNAKSRGQDSLDFDVYIIYCLESKPLKKDKRRKNHKQATSI